jgi:D-aspartate ligase
VADLLDEHGITEREESILLTDGGIVDLEHLFSLVPKYVIKHYVHDEELKNRALKLMKEGRWTFPIKYAADKNPKRIFYTNAVFYNQIRKYKIYG